MSYSNRNLSPVACVVNTVLYHAYIASNDVLHGVISIAVLHDDTIKRQDLHDVMLHVCLSGVFVRIKPWEFVIIPSHYHLYNGTHSSMHNWRLLIRTTQASKLEKAYNHTTMHRWKFCMVTQIAPFAEYLPQWVMYHRRIGIDRVYVFDNGSKHNISQLLASKTDVEV